MNNHENAASQIVSAILGRLNLSIRRLAITLAGESGCGKTETGKALITAFGKQGINAIVLGQDNYFFLPPKENDRQRKTDNTWLGPHKEVNLELMDKHLGAAKNGAASIDVPHIQYDTNVSTVSTVSLEGIGIIIAEGTYTSLLRQADVRIFIDEDYNATLKYRKLRNRGNEVNDPFVENILETEHKIIAGHKFLADFIILESLEVVAAG
jgi:uridine kinase